MMAEKIADFIRKLFGETPPPPEACPPDPKPPVQKTPSPPPALPIPANLPKLFP